MSATVQSRLLLLSLLAHHSQITLIQTLSDPLKHLQRAVPHEEILHINHEERSQTRDVGGWSIIDFARRAAAGSHHFGLVV